jgi:hypothetical protein
METSKCGYGRIAPGCTVAAGNNGSMHSINAFNGAIIIVLFLLFTSFAKKKLREKDKILLSIHILCLFVVSFAYGVYITSTLT